MMPFPYKRLKNFIEKLQQNKTFLFKNEEVINLSNINIDSFEEAINSKDIKADHYPESIRSLDDNSKKILLHAYWLWYYPFGLESAKSQLNTLFGENLINSIKDEYIEEHERLSSVGGYGQLQHKEVLWIINEVFTLIQKSKNYDEFKNNYVCKYKNRNDIKISTKNLLLHILEPSNYESIAKQDHKEKIVATFKSLLKTIDPTKTDDALKEIRNSLKLTITDSFYSTKYKDFWQDDLSTPLKKLEYKKSLILYGPPGTGKTYTAIEIAKSLIVKGYLKGLYNTQLLTNDKIDNIINYLNNKTENDLLNNDPHISYLQFHINYNYEDFIAGQTIKNDDVRTKKGFIFDVISKAERDKMPHVVILDEINRTDISRVFGELFTAIEKRGKDVYLTLPNPNGIGRLILNVPDNIYFIGTMNEIDFSLERVDFALRRRFVWEYCGYDKDALKAIINNRLNSCDNGINAQKFVEACTKLNDEIGKHPLMGPEFHIGHAFFAEIANIYNHLEDFNGKNKWKNAQEILWEISIKPTLEAYCGTMDKKEKEKYLKPRSGKQQGGIFYNAYFGNDYTPLDEQDGES